MRKSTIVLLLTGILSLVYVNGLAWHYAAIRSQGNLVYLELAPVDPISLVQGQYMRLRFDLVRQQAALPEAERDLFTEDPSAGVLAVLELDDNRVGTVTRLIPENPADSTIRELEHEYGSNGYALLGVEVDDRFRRIRLRQNSFLFEENTPEKYNDARYGIFRVTDSGEYILVDLAGEDFKPMTTVKK